MYKKAESAYTKKRGAGVKYFQYDGATDINDTPFMAILNFLKSSLEHTKKEFSAIKLAILIRGINTAMRLLNDRSSVLWRASGTGEINLIATAFHLYHEIVQSSLLFEDIKNTLFHKEVSPRNRANIKSFCIRVNHHFNVNLPRLRRRVKHFIWLHIVEIGRKSLVASISNGIILKSGENAENNSSSEHKNFGTSSGFMRGLFSAKNGVVSPSNTISSKNAEHSVILSNPNCSSSLNVLFQADLGILSSLLQINCRNTVTLDLLSFCLGTLISELFAMVLVSKTIKVTRSIVVWLTQQLMQIQLWVTETHPLMSTTNNTQDEKLMFDCVAWQHADAVLQMLLVHSGSNNSGNRVVGSSPIISRELEVPTLRRFDNGAMESIPEPAEASMHATSVKMSQGSNAERKQGLSQRIWSLRGNTTASHGRSWSLSFSSFSSRRHKASSILPISDQQQSQSPSYEIVNPSLAVNPKRNQQLQQNEDSCDGHKDEQQVVSNPRGGYIPFSSASNGYELCKPEEYAWMQVIASAGAGTEGTNGNNKLKSRRIGFFNFG